MDANVFLVAAQMIGDIRTQLLRYFGMDGRLVVSLGTLQCQIVTPEAPDSRTESPMDSQPVVSMKRATIVALRLYDSVD